MKKQEIAVMDIFVPTPILPTTNRFEKKNEKRIFVDIFIYLQ
jgi:hypothetical protein